jgi:hypothetical protein
VCVCTSMRVCVYMRVCYRVRDPTKKALLIEACPDSFAAKMPAVLEFVRSKAFNDLVMGTSARGNQPQAGIQDQEQRVTSIKTFTN